ncbi:MAG: FAD:protein FMN transferase [Vicinamibacterales bacterium]
MRHRVAWSVVLASALLAAPASPRAEGPLTTTVRRFLMGTSITVEATGGVASSRAVAVDEAFAAMVEVDRLMSNYKPDSELMRLNADAARRPVRVSDPMWSVLAAGQRVSRASGGAFDVTVGPLVRLWGFHDKRPHVPSAAELRRIRPIIGYQNVVLDEAAHTVRFIRPGVELDLGGIAKGFAVELAGRALERRGYAGLVDAGGNQFLVGHPLNKARWQVGIADPEHPTKILGTLEVDGGAVSTSGGYHNYFVSGGKTYGHLIDPRTMAPGDAALSVTIVSPDATLADALSKPAYLLGPVTGLALVESFPGAMAIIAYRGTNGGVELMMSEGLKGRFRKTATSRP